MPSLARSQRLEARISSEQKAMVEQAAALEGRSVTDFVLASVQAAARKTIADHQYLTLSAEDGRAFVSALLNPPRPSSQLVETVRRYRDLSQT